MVSQHASGLAMLLIEPLKQLLVHCLAKLGLYLDLERKKGALVEALWRTRCREGVTSFLVLLEAFARDVIWE